jgi:hypothetical protein
VRESCAFPHAQLRHRGTRTQQGRGASRSYGIYNHELSGGHHSLCIYDPAGRPGRPETGSTRFVDAVVSPCLLPEKDQNRRDEPLRQCVRHWKSQDAAARRPRQQARPKCSSSIALTTSALSKKLSTIRRFLPPRFSRSQIKCRAILLKLLIRNLTVKRLNAKRHLTSDTERASLTTAISDDPRTRSWEQLGSRHSHASAV